jgi:protein-S-isoprenylcysteine O-methyltransferase Ste14
MACCTLPARQSPLIPYSRFDFSYCFRYLVRLVSCGREENFVLRSHNPRVYPHFLSALTLVALVVLLLTHLGTSSHFHGWKIWISYAYIVALLVACIALIIGLTLWSLSTSAHNYILHVCRPSSLVDQR